MQRSIRLGSRGSKLALIQAKRTQTLLQTLRPDSDVDIIVINTTGDIDKSSPLSQIGGKGVFIKALQDALINHDIDIAVHSLKDVTSSPPEGLLMAGFLSRESHADAWISASGLSIEDLPSGAVIGTGSIRRKALLHKRRPDIVCKDIRGNVQTRIDKIKSENLDGVILSEAGLIRLGLDQQITQSLNPDEFYPAPGQGVIALECRESDSELAHLCADISDPEQAKLSRLEYDVIQILGFDCQIPLGMQTRLSGDQIEMKIAVADRDFNWKEMDVFTSFEKWESTLHEINATFQGYF